MFQTISNVQSGDAVSLQQYVDNRSGDLCVGLRSITYTVGWYNIYAGASFTKRNRGFIRENKTKISPGLYSFAQLQALFGEDVSLEVNEFNGLITLTVAAGKEVSFTDGLLKMLGLDDGLGGQWLQEGTYDGDRPVNFMPIKMLYVHLEQLNSTANILDGAPSTLLTVVGLKNHSFGDVDTIRVEHPEFKRLQCGTISELKIVVCNDKNQPVNSDLPISALLEIR